jgi:tRNA-uridine 2-sulfurtransferase
MTHKTPAKKIALGLSGGVDSAVSAYLLKEQGHDVTAVYLECWKQEGCRAEQDRQDALRVALQLDIPFQVLDFKQAYQERVMSYFLEEYRAGRTPNPDVLCNSVVKFGLFYEWAIQQGFDAIATGHYAQIKRGEAQNLQLATGKDLHKDQTYFLHQIRQEQLAHVSFPIGHLLKSEVRSLAKELKLPVADKKDSVGICFVGDINVTEYLRENLGEKRGEIVTSDGEVIGRHRGLWFYTIGQRHGFEVNMKLVQQHTTWHQPEIGLPPLYVVGKNPKKNQLVVGTKPETASSSFAVNDLHRIDPAVNWADLSLWVRIRHTGELVKCAFEESEEEKAGERRGEVKTAKKLEGVAQGQFAVFYTKVKDGEREGKDKDQMYICLGGGVIE